MKQGKYRDMGGGWDGKNNTDLSLSLFLSFCRNGQKAWDHLSQVADLKDKVYIPKIYPEISTKRVLVCEWIDQAAQLTDRQKITDMGLDYKEAMKISIEAFASQIFLSGFVHGKWGKGNDIAMNTFWLAFSW